MPEADVDVIDQLSQGFVSPKRAREIDAEHPDAKRELVGWIRDAVRSQSWPRAGRLINLGAQLKPEGLGQLLCDLLDADIEQLNTEDIIEIVGELEEPGAETSLFAAIERSRASDSPAYWLTQKAISALGSFDTDMAATYLRQLTESDWPKVVRWYAAIELGTEESLDFGEDEAMG